MIIADFGIPFHMDVSPIFKPWGPKVTTTDKENEVEKIVTEADLVCFGGGADIHPSLYGARNVSSWCREEPSPRDLFEQLVYKTAKIHGKPVLGICRGAQFVCVMNGGSLIQHVDGHGGVDHDLIFREGDAYDGKVITANSVHHQMMLPSRRKRNSTLLAWTPNLSGRFFYDDDALKKRDMPVLPFAADRAYDVPDTNPEVVYFQDREGPRCLAIQGHPEFIADCGELDHPFVQMTREMVTSYLRVRP